MSPLGLPDVDSGFEWGARVGLAWQPFSATPRTPPGRRSSSTRPRASRCRFRRPTDVATPGACAAAGAGRRPRCSRSTSAPRCSTSTYANANFNQISPRSFWANLKEGFTYDDNKFRTNQLVHPFNGSTYFNAARANGIGFWGSSGMSLAGAFIWECCGETHPMSFNDMISTGIGGHRPRRDRLPGLVAHPRQHEAGQGALRARGGGAPLRPDPRLQPGRRRATASEVKGNPADPLDWRPEFQLTIRGGARVIGQGESISENTNTYGFLEWVLNYGDPWDGKDHRPYDRFDVQAAVELRRQDPPGAAADPGRPLHEAARGRNEARPHPPAGLRLHRQRGLRVRRPEPRARPSCPSGSRRGSSASSPASRPTASSSGR